MRTYALRSRIVSVVLAIVFIIATFNFSSVSALTTAESDENILLNDKAHTEVTGFSKEAKSEIALKTELGETVFEIESLRESNVKHFHLEDGSYQAVVYAEPVHKLNNDGKWDVIDNTLYSDGNSLKTKDNRLTFAKYIDGVNDIFTIHDGEYDIVFGTTGDFKSSGYVVPRDIIKYEDKIEELKAIDRLSSEIRYDSAFANASLSYHIETNNVKESIIISEKDPASNYAYSFKISLSGLEAFLEDGEVLLYDETTKKVKYKISRPYMYDDNDELSFDVEYNLVSIGSGNYALTITPNSDWINDSERVFPITIDPSLLDVGQTIDSYVYSSYPNKNYGGEHELWVSNVRQTYYKFATPHFPSGINITSASVKLPYYYYVVNNESMEVGIYRITSSWSEKSVTWNNKPSTASSNLDTKEVYADGALSSNPQYATFSVTNYVKSWYTGTSNYGFALKREGGSNTSVIFVAREKMQKFAQLTIYYNGTHLAEGVYSIKKQNENTYLKSYIPENLAWVLQDTTSFTSPPTTREHFENMFKIAYRPEHDDYVIRSMLDNALVVYPSPYNNAPIAGRRTESDSALSTGFTWNLVYNNGYYNITYTENGTTYYVKSLSTENNAKVVFTTNVNDSGTKWSFYKYNDITEEDIEMDKRASTLLPGESFAFVAHMFSTRIGHNGPLIYSVTNDDGTTTDKATINSSTGVLQAVKPGKIKVRVTYSGAPWIWQWDLIITKVIQIACFNNLGYWDVPNSATSQYVECNESNQLKRGTWFFEAQGGGYYAIRNYVTGYYLKNVSNNLVHTNSVGTSLTNDLLWKPIHLDDDTYKIQSKLNTSYYIAEQNVSHSTQDPDIVLSNSDEGTRNKWNFYPKFFEITIYNYYDYSFQVRLDGGITSTTNTINEIMNRQNKLNNYLFSEFGIVVTNNTPSRLISYADKCHGISNINTATIDSNCVHGASTCDGRKSLCNHILTGTGTCSSSCSSPYHHNNSLKIHSWYQHDMSSASANINIMWTGHKNCSCDDCYVPWSSGTHITATLYNSPNTNYRDYTAFHETGHSLGAEGDTHCTSTSCVMSYSTSWPTYFSLLSNPGCDTFCDNCEMQIRQNVYNTY